MRLLILFLFSFTLLSGQNSVTDRTEPQAKQLIDSLYTLVKNGSDIGKLAMLYSEDPGTRARGGLCLNIKYGRFVPEFDNEVLNLESGGISKPFRTSYGYHFLQVLEKLSGSFTIRHILIKFKE